MLAGGMTSAGKRELAYELAGSNACLGVGPSKTTAS